MWRCSICPSVTIFIAIGGGRWELSPLSIVPGACARSVWPSLLVLRTLRG